MALLDAPNGDKKGANLLMQNNRNCRNAFARRPQMVLERVLSCSKKQGNRRNDTPR